MILDIVYQHGSAFGIGSPNISWTEAMDMDYSMFQLVRRTVLELQTEEVKKLPKPK